jgi:LytR cell envelope-related transcriptional attenuator
MTALSPMGRVPQRRPVPPRVKPHRRPGPWLAFLSVLIVLAVVVWWRVLGADTEHNSADGCLPRIDQSVTSMDPRTVKVRVYNATDRRGLARQVADGLRKHRFSILVSTNDPLDTRQVAGIGEIRYGSAGEKQALLLSFWLPGIQLVPDPRTDAAVDLAVGPAYRALATDAQVRKAQAAAIDAPPTGEGC